MANIAEIASIRKGITLEQAQLEIAAITNGKSEYMADLAIRHYLETDSRHIIDNNMDIHQVNNFKE